MGIFYVFEISDVKYAWSSLFVIFYSVSFNMVAWSAFGIEFQMEWNDEPYNKASKLSCPFILTVIFWN